MSEETMSCCKCCCSFIFISGLTALFLWLDLRGKIPTCSIENFDVFILNKTSPNSMFKNNHTIRYDLKLNNRNEDKGIYYDTLLLVFYYKPNLTLGNATFDRFYQGHGESTRRISTLDATGVKWENDTANTTAKFRVELNTSVRFKIVFWKTKRYHLELGADLEVNEQGSLIKKKKKGVKLTSGARTRSSRGCYFELLLFLSALFLATLIC